MTKQINKLELANNGGNVGFKRKISLINFDQIDSDALKTQSQLDIIREKEEGKPS